MLALRDLKHIGCCLDRPKVLIEATEQRPHLPRRVPGDLLVGFQSQPLLCHFSTNNIAERGWMRPPESCVGTYTQADFRRATQPVDPPTVHFSRKRYALEAIHAAEIVGAIWVADAFS